MGSGVEKSRIRIEDYYDGFAVYVDDERFSFNQEDTRKGLVKVFRALGLEAVYEEVY